MDEKGALQEAVGHHIPLRAALHNFMTLYSNVMPWRKQSDTTTLLELLNIFMISFNFCSKTMGAKNTLHNFVGLLVIHAI